MKKLTWANGQLKYNTGEQWLSYKTHTLLVADRPGESPGYSTMQLLLKLDYTIVSNPYD